MLQHESGLSLCVFADTRHVGAMDGPLEIGLKAASYLPTVTKRDRKGVAPVALYTRNTRPVHPLPYTPFLHGLPP